jgi:hypothetical protein
MSVPGCVKIAEALFAGLFFSVFLIAYDIIGSGFHYIFFRTVSLVADSANPNILCSGQAQVLHSLLTALSTLSSA